jgi:hypothetical protein
VMSSTSNVRRSVTARVPAMKSVTARRPLRRPIHGRAPSSPGISKRASSLNSAATSSGCRPSCRAAKSSPREADVPRLAHLTSPDEILTRRLPVGEAATLEWSMNGYSCLEATSRQLRQSDGKTPPASHLANDP